MLDTLYRDLVQDMSLMGALHLANNAAEIKNPNMMVESLERFVNLANNQYPLSLP